MSWNICRGLQRDLPRVAAAGIDVAVLCEAPLAAPDPTLDIPDVAWCSAGDLTDRALVVAGLTTGLSRIGPRPNEGRWTCAATTSEGLGIVGIWTCPERGRTYGAELGASIDAYADVLVSRPCIVAGDFNVSPAGAEDTRTGVLRRAFDQLQELGYESAYHHFTGRDYGDEAHHTYFHRYREAEPFHIDFVFLHRDLLASLRSVEIGTYADWVAPTSAGWRHSDHVPVVVDFDLPRDGLAPAVSQA